MAITATMVKDLRDKTGAGMMDCKAALEATSGEEQVQEQIVAANVDDEGDRRPGVRDVREVLIGPDPEVRAAADARLAQRGNRVLVRLLVRDQVVAVEVTGRLRELRDLLGEGRRRLGRRAASRLRARAGQRVSTRNTARLAS